MWCHSESNQGHKDFQSFALPTELWHLVLHQHCDIVITAVLRVQSYNIFLKLQIFESKKSHFPAFFFFLDV